MDEQNNKTCIISTFSSIHLPSYMSKDQTVFKLLQDPDFADVRTNGQTDTWTEEKPKVPSSETSVGDYLVREKKACCYYALCDN